MSLEICRRRAGETATPTRRLGVARTRLAEARRARVDLTRLVEARRMALGDRRLVDRRLTGILIFIEEEKIFKKKLI
jgi:hypothetical protein